MRSLGFGDPKRQSFVALGKVQEKAKEEGGIDKITQQHQYCVCSFSEVFLERLQVERDDVVDDDGGGSGGGGPQPFVADDSSGDPGRRPSAYMIHMLASARQIRPGSSRVSDSDSDLVCYFLPGGVEHTKAAHMRVSPIDRLIDRSLFSCLRETVLIIYVYACTGGSS